MKKLISIFMVCIFVAIMGETVSADTYENCKKLLPVHEDFITCLYFKEGIDFEGLDNYCLKWNCSDPKYVCKSGGMLELGYEYKKCAALIKDRNQRIAEKKAEEKAEEAKRIAAEKAEEAKRTQERQKEFLNNNVGVSSALPVCKDSPRIISYFKEVKSWSNCHGSIMIAKPVGQIDINAYAGMTYVGEFKDGKNHGQGTLTYADGAKYVGEFKDDQRHGQGTYTFVSGSKHVGEFKDGKPNGLVFEIDHDGGGKHTEWKDGKRIKVLKQFYSDRSLKEYQQNFIKQNASAQRLEGYNSSPPQQIFLEKLISTTKSTISADYNSAKKKRAWIMASRKLCSSQDFDATGEKVDWVGYVDHVLMDDDGSVSLKISINKHGNEVLDRDLDEKLIDIALELKESTLLHKGDFIKFSGYFKKGDLKQNECLDAGIDSNPELGNESFTFKFTKIKKIN